jgi:hypothetical protein
LPSTAASTLGLVATKWREIEAFWETLSTETVTCWCYKEDEMNWKQCYRAQDWWEKNANECNKDVRELLRFDVSCCWSWAFFRFFASPAKSTPHHFTPSNDNSYLPIYTCGMLKSSGSQPFLKFMSSSDL